MSLHLTVSSDSFEAFGPSHRVALAALLVGLAGLVWIGRRLRGTSAEKRMSRGLAVAVLVVMVPLQALYFTPAYFDWKHTLPFQLCDVASLVAVYALWKLRPAAVALTYYWGLTLTTQAIITPDLGSDFPDPVFILFWAMHLLVVWAAAYLTWGLGLTPTWRTFRQAVACTVAWAVTVFAFNAVAGTNYGYLNGKPANPSVLDFLGPWPGYVAAEITIVAIIWALITWPWMTRSAGTATPQTTPRSLPSGASPWKSSTHEPS